MRSLYDQASIEAAPIHAVHPQLRDLLADRIGRLPPELIDLTHFLCVEPGDTEADIVAETTLSPLVDPITGRRFGEPGFEPWWDWLQCHHGAFELIITVGNGGHAVVLLIADIEGVDHDLLSLCRTYAR